MIQLFCTPCQCSVKQRMDAWSCFAGTIAQERTSGSIANQMETYPYIFNRILTTFNSCDACKLKALSVVFWDGNACLFFINYSLVHNYRILKKVCLSSLLWRRRISQNKQLLFGLERLNKYAGLQFVQRERKIKPVQSLQSWAIFFTRKNLPCGLEFKKAVDALDLPYFLKNLILDPP